MKAHDADYLDATTHTGPAAPSDAAATLDELAALCRRLARQYGPPPAVGSWPWSIAEAWRENTDLARMAGHTPAPVELIADNPDALGILKTRALEIRGAFLARTLPPLRTRDHD